MLKSSPLIRWFINSSYVAWPPILWVYLQNMPEILSHYEGRHLSLREIDDWQFATRPNATGVVGIFAMTTDRQVILIADEAIVDCAKRELIEETGYTAGKISLLLSSPTSAGMTDETTHLFFAEDCQRTDSGGGVDGEDITTHLVPFAELAPFLSQASERGLLIDFKIHACLGALSLNSSQR
jgi:ADP-ribose pyrophosphatase